MCVQGLKVAVIEGHDIGGTCVNRGCVPSKALLAASGRVRDLKNAMHLQSLGIQVWLSPFVLDAWKTRQIKGSGCAYALEVHIRHAPPIPGHPGLALICCNLVFPELGLRACARDLEHAMHLQSLGIQVRLYRSCNAVFGLEAHVGPHNAMYLQSMGIQVWFS